MFKEKGYDEFLAEKIRRGDEDFKAGNVISLAESKEDIRQLIEQKSKELAMAEREFLIYG
ncbi:MULTISPECIES: hypothetical protein [Avibacterium]|uniref:Uncharacterized protein n=2 Tax=Avibacterium TaxID=292486 RepID=A0AAE5WGI5_AVIPA|nr:MULTISPECIES: hypothetical protein [Avibacterium]MCW9715704.1 hypothetical protein [Avibacterium sp. 21-594]MEE3609232.1 hypothetical protein [Avibacterium paragallinarum]MEE3620750.1 hypothetical protein [Avibacterium paragallinarum]MEE3668494.1 hypothetical protein [Avibacterium paragallinarum]MEE3680952.1 hypothetical protein [Avibacterium paragallinarum]